MEEQPKTKLCLKCGHEKPVTEFYTNCKSKGGLQYWCKECVATDNKERRQKQRSAERAAHNIDTPYSDLKPREILDIIRTAKAELTKRGYTINIKCTYTQIIEL